MSICDQCVLLVLTYHAEILTLQVYEKIKDTSTKNGKSNVWIGEGVFESKWTCHVARLRKYLSGEHNTISAEDGRQPGK